MARGQELENRITTLFEDDPEKLATLCDLLRDYDHFATGWRPDRPATHHCFFKAEARLLGREGVNVL